MSAHLTKHRTWNVKVGRGGGTIWTGFGLFVLFLLPIERNQRGKTESKGERENQKRRRESEGGGGDVQDVQTFTHVATPKIDTAK